MADFNLGNLISKFVNYRLTSTPTSVNTQSSASQTLNTPAPSAPNVTTSSNAPANLSMGSMGEAGQAAYAKDVMNLPKNMNEFVYMIQRNMTQAQIQAQFGARISQHNALSQTQAQILAQLQGLSTAEIQSMLAAGDKAVLGQLQSAIRNLPISSQGLINLSDISAMIQANGKDAIAKLITTMANASRVGIADLSQLKETARLINASVAAAAQNDSAQTMKMLLLLYLPWLPLQEGTGFDLDIIANSDGEDGDSILIITITTLNFGDIVATLILENSNSVNVHIACSEKFPKDELTLRIGADEKHYSMQSVINYQTVENKSEQKEKLQAKVNMSNTNLINPFMLLMAHSVIRHTMEIDRLANSF